MPRAAQGSGTCHAPPVISRLGSSSKSMYTLRLPLATDLTAFTSLRCSSAFKHLLICCALRHWHAGGHASPLPPK